MIGYILAVLGLAALCGGWILMQMWTGKLDPEQGEYKGGCAACNAADCDNRKSKDQ